MKIYPSIHKAKEVRRPKFLDIPVAHIEKNYIPTAVKTEIEPEFAHASSSYLAPYQEFDTDDFLIFEDDGAVSETKLKFRNGKYVYIPENTMEFEPTKFSFTATVQRKGKIHGDRNYNFRIGFYKQKGAKDLAKKLMPIFGDAPYRGKAPTNITVNGGSTDIDSMIAESGKNLDFLFIQGSTDEFFKESSEGRIPYEKLMDSRINIWLTLSDIGGYKWFKDLKLQEDAYKITRLTEEDGQICMVPEEKSAGSGVYASAATYSHVARSNVSFKMFPRGVYDYVMQPTAACPKTPIFVLKSPYGNYIIVSHEKLFDYTGIYGSFIYDVLSRVYERGFVSVSSDETWITKEPVDYLGSLNVPFHRCHPVLNLWDVIIKSGEDVEDFELHTMRTSKIGAAFDHMDEDRNVYFKAARNEDPERRVGDTSIFTYQHTVLQYPAQKAKVVESGVKITTSVEDGKCYFTVFPFSSSKRRLLLKNARTFEIEDVEKPYILYALPMSSETGESIVGVIQEGDLDYDPEASVRIAKIWTEFIGEPEAYDIRQLGGGLPSSYADYDMLDIGNPKGKPYRIGTGAVIKIPKAYQKYADKIQKAIESYKVAADQFYVIYE